MVLDIQTVLEKRSNSEQIRGEKMTFIRERKLWDGIVTKNFVHKNWKVLISSSAPNVAFIRQADKRKRAVRATTRLQSKGLSN